MDISQPQVVAAAVTAGTAAILSLVAALVSYLSARSARRSATELASKQHRLAEVERLSNELRAAYQSFAVGMGSVGEAVAPKIGPALAGLEALRTCVAASSALESAADSTQKAIQTFGDRRAGFPNFPMDKLRAAYRDCQMSLSEQRLAILKEPGQRNAFRVLGSRTSER